MEIAHNQYYVYAHVDPDTHEIVYVGKGSNGRAWTANPRRPDHAAWMRAQAAKYGPSMHINILVYNLTPQRACEIESELIELHTPVFNVKLTKTMSRDDRNAKRREKYANDSDYRVWLNAYQRNYIKDSDRRARNNKRAKERYDIKAAERKAKRLEEWKAKEPERIAKRLQRLEYGRQYSRNRAKRK